MAAVSISLTEIRYSLSARGVRLPIYCIREETCPSIWKGY
jgi:hypothetical protein